MHVHIFSVPDGNRLVIRSTRPIKVEQKNLRSDNGLMRLIESASRPDQPRPLKRYTVTVERIGYGLSKHIVEAVGSVEAGSEAMKREIDKGFEPSGWFRSEVCQ